MERHYQEGGEQYSQQNGEGHRYEDGEYAEHDGGSAAETPHEGAPMVENSLHGLVNELDKLRESLGYSNHLEVIEQHLQNLQTENEELRSYAEQAIKEAERLASINDELSSRLHQQELDEQMGAVLAETQKLKDVADEFEKDLVQQKLVEAEERSAEIMALKNRVRELEDENVALTHTLNEFRQSTEQLQRLRLMEDGAGLGAAVAFGSPAALTPLAPPPAAAAGGKPRRRSSAAGAAAASEGRVSGPAPPSPPGSISSAGGVAGAGRAGSVTSQGTAGGSVGAGAGAAPRPDPARLAEQLAAVAGGADVGVVASAAKCLKDYASLETALAHERQEADRLRHEVEELRDTMFSKSFKPPSAWAEREVKYKMEKKSWEDRHKELGARLAMLEVEVAEYRAAGKTHQYEERIQELEAQLLQTEREKDGARAQLHELQITMRSQNSSPDNPRFAMFGAEGSSRRTDEGEGVHSVVAELERHNIGMLQPGLASRTASESGAHPQFTVGGSFSEGGGGEGGEGGALTPRMGGVGGGPKSERLRALAQDRASADAAWEEHNKKQDVGALRRSKAELETKVAMLEQQIGKMQWAIEHADQQQAQFEEQLDTALQSGDVSKLSSLREKLKAGLTSPGRVFRRNKGLSPAKLAMSKQLHQTTDALRSSEAEKNALRRQLAKLSKKYKAMAEAGAGGAAAGAAAGAVAVAADATGGGVSAAPAAQQAAQAQQSAPATPGAAGGRASLDSSRSGSMGKHSAGAGPVAGPIAIGAAAAGGSGSEVGRALSFDGMGSAQPSPGGASDATFMTEDLDEFLVPGIDDSEMEVLALREENELLMDQLVTTKIRLAETEGDFLRSKRDLLRAQEKHQQMTEQLDQIRLEQQAAAAAAAAQMSPLAAGAQGLVASQATSTATSPMQAPTASRSSTQAEEGAGLPGMGLPITGSVGGFGGSVGGGGGSSVAAFEVAAGSPQGPSGGEGGQQQQQQQHKEAKRSKSWIGGLKL